MENGQHQRTAIHHHFFAAQACPDKGNFLGRPLVQAGDDQSENDQRYQNHAGINQGRNQTLGHYLLSFQSGHMLPAL